MIDGGPGRCAHGGVPVGFSGRLGGEGRGRVWLSCGCVAEARDRVEVSPFSRRYAEALSWCDPAAGVVGRGALSQVPVFYRHVPGEGVAFSTWLGDLVGPQTPTHPGVVAALVVGRPIPAPLTPYREIWRLGAGSVLSAHEDKPRLWLREFDWTTLVPAGRASASSLLRVALEAAVTESAPAVITLSGGSASAALLRVAASSETPGVHVAVEIPVLGDRGKTLAGRAEVVDGTGVWEAAREARCPPLPQHCDPWPQVSLEAAAGRRVVSGAGLSALFAGKAPVLSWWQRSWRALAVELAEEDLLGASWRLALRRRPPRAHDRASDDPWLDTERAKVATTAVGPTAGSHLLTGIERAAGVVGSVAQRVMALVESLDLADPGNADSNQDGPSQRAAPRVVHAALHPAVVGAALTGRAETRWQGGRLIDASPVVDVAGQGFSVVDAPDEARQRLFAADLVTHRLASPSTRDELLARLEARPGLVAVGGLKAVLADQAQRLAHSLGLHRLLAVSARYPMTWEG